MVGRDAGKSWRQHCTLGRGQLPAALAPQPSHPTRPTRPVPAAPPRPGYPQRFSESGYVMLGEALAASKTLRRLSFAGSHMGLQRLEVGWVERAGGWGRWMGP